jgi:hypothetical protein
MALSEAKSSTLDNGRCLNFHARGTVAPQLQQRVASRQILRSDDVRQYLPHCEQRVQRRAARYDPDCRRGVAYPNSVEVRAHMRGTHMHRAYTACVCPRYAPRGFPRRSEQTTNRSAADGHLAAPFADSRA